MRTVATGQIFDLLLLEFDRIPNRMLKYILFIACFLFFSTKLLSSPDRSILDRAVAGSLEQQRYQDAENLLFHLLDQRESFSNFEILSYGSRGLEYTVPGHHWEESIRIIKSGTKAIHQFKPTTSVHRTKFQYLDCFKNQIFFLI